MFKIFDEAVGLLILFVNAAALSYLCGRFLDIHTNKIIKNNHIGNMLVVFCYLLLGIIKASIPSINSQFQWEMFFVFFLLIISYERNRQIKIYITALLWTVIELGTFIAFGIEVLFRQMTDAFLHWAHNDRISYFIKLADGASYVVFLFCYLIIVKSVIKVVCRKYPPDKKELSGKEFFLL